MQNISLQQFEDDLINFIKSHPYLAEQETEPIISTSPKSDRIFIQIPTVDGDYELINITIQYIS